MSIGLLVDQDTPMIWRGPMATSALTQLFNDTLWGDLDDLLIDLPPGTGDIQLTLSQKIPVAVRWLSPRRKKLRRWMRARL